MITFHKGKNPMTLRATELVEALQKWRQSQSLPALNTDELVMLIDESSVRNEYYEMYQRQKAKLKIEIAKMLEEKEKSLNEQIQKLQANCLHFLVYHHIGMDSSDSWIQCRICGASV